MKKPENYEIKKELCRWGPYMGIKVKGEMRNNGHYKYIYIWRLTTSRGTDHDFDEDVIAPLVILKPEYGEVLQVQPWVKKEMQNYEAFCIAESKDLAEYERLKAKFEGA